MEGKGQGTTTLGIQGVKWRGCFRIGLWVRGKAGRARHNHSPSAAFSLRMLSSTWPPEYAEAHTTSHKHYDIPAHLECACSLQLIRRSNRDPSLAATCAKWSRYQPGTLAVGWTDGRVSFTDESCGATTRGTANNSKSQLVSPNEGCGSVVDLR